MKIGHTGRVRVALLIVLAGSFAGCNKSEAPATKGRPPVPVLVAGAEVADVPVELRALGTVEAIQSSPVRSLLTGTITEVAFREGDMVRAGQVLFHLDRRPLEATLRQLQANLARDEAQVRSAEAQTQSAEA